MSFSETIFLFVLALIVFGPKKLPEIARQAGRILAELRRASNEFRSQIETEIAHLEVEKKTPVLPPSQPPPGAVASLNPSPAAAVPAPLQLESVAAPATQAAASPSAASDPVAPASTSTAESVPDTSVPTSQESHV